MTECQKILQSSKVSQTQYSQLTGLLQSSCKKKKVAWFFFLFFFVAVAAQNVILQYIFGGIHY